MNGQPSGGLAAYVCGAELAFDPSVTVTVGPMVGRVTDTSAVVVVEVGRAARVTLLASVVTPEAPAGRVVARCVRQLPAGRPRAFLLTGLVPGARHVVMLSGVARPDALARFAVVRTLTGGEAVLRVVAVAGDAAEGAEEGPTGAWAHVSAAVQAGEVDIVVHTGGQVGSGEWGVGSGEWGVGSGEW